MIALVGTDGGRPVVWGLGLDEEAARDDASAYFEPGERLIAVVISDEEAARVQAGDVDASAWVRAGREIGEIVPAPGRGL